MAAIEIVFSANNLIFTNKICYTSHFNKELFGKKYYVGEII